MIARFLAFVSVPLAVVLLLAGCDQGGSDETAVLNAESPIPPTVEYTFTYTSEDVNSNGRVDVTSQDTDGLGAVLRDNGFSREEVVSARVDSVVLRGRSSPESTRKIYEYVQRAEIYFPSDASTPVAEGDIQTSQGPDEVRLSVVNSGVTSAVQQDGKRARLELDTQEGGFTEQYRAEAEIFFRIEVEGV